MFSNIGILGLVLIIIIFVVLLAIPIAIILLIVNSKKGNIRLRRVEEKLDKSLSDKGK